MLIFISIALLNKMGAHPLLLTRTRCVAYATLVVGACVATIAIYARFAVYEFFVAMFTVLVVLDVAMGLTWSSRQRVSTWAVYASIACIALGKVCWEVEVRVCSVDARVWPLHVVWHGFSCASAYCTHAAAAQTSWTRDTRSLLRSRSLLLAPRSLLFACHHARCSDEFTARALGCGKMAC